jgi:hypothetical protein
MWSMILLDIVQKEMKICGETDFERSNKNNQKENRA